MNLFNFLLFALFALLSVIVAQEDGHRLSNARVLRYPSAAHARDISSSILPRSSNAEKTSFNDARAATDQCHEEDRNVCAELIVGNNTVNQQIRIDDDGCTPVLNASDVTAIDVFDCWCGLWNAADETACDDGDDVVVDDIDSCAGLVTRQQRNWKEDPTHISCFRQT